MKIGKSYFIRTVTYHLVGRVTKIKENWITLEEASVVFNTDNMTTMLRTGTIASSNDVGDVTVNYVGDATVNANSITDFFPWKHELETA